LNAIEQTPIGKAEGALFVIVENRAVQQGTLLILQGRRHYRPLLITS
jgi:hypothetical protein